MGKTITYEKLISQKAFLSSAFLPIKYQGQACDWISCLAHCIHKKTADLLVQDDSKQLSFRAIYTWAFHTGLLL